MSGVKKKRFIVTVSKKFLSNHSKAGELTGFAFKILEGTKKHTIRPNYEGWRKKFEEIEKGNGDLILKQWTGKPYHSKQETIIELGKEKGVGVSKLTFSEKDGFLVNDSIKVTFEELAKNDGLSIEDFKEWFKDFPEEPMAIIHFSSFRYK